MSDDQKPKIIIQFKDNVSKEKIAKYAEDIVKAGGVVKDSDRYWEKPGGIVNGFAATLPNVEYLETFKNLTSDEIDTIEGDGIVTTKGVTNAIS